jgi:hypothetical protein
MNLERSLLKFSSLALILLLLSTQASAQTAFENALKSFDSKTVVGYTQPLQDLFAANMTSGWYRSAEIPQSGLHISFNIVAMGAILSDDQKTYDAALPAGYTQTTFKAPTVFGDKNVAVFTDPVTGLSFGQSGGALNAGLFPLAALQGTIGHIQGTELIVRFVPLPEISNFPKITFWGIGGRHSISQYFEDEPPVHVAFGIFYNQISAGDIITIKSFLVGPQVSKSFAVLDLYGGFGYTKNTMTLNFNSTSAGAGTVNVELEGKDKVRGTVGAGLNLGVFRLNVDLNFGSVTAIAASLGFGF